MTNETGLIVAAPQPVTLFRTDDPAAVITRATEMADALKRVIDRKGFISRISGREYVRVEGWTLLGSMLGVFPVCIWTRSVENGWEARVEARTRDGAVVGAAEAECLHSEKNWSDRDDFALRSMAQTRATAKALRLPLGFVVAMAGYDPTPADEMPDPEPRHGSERPAQQPLPNGRRTVANPDAEITDAQANAIRRMLDSLSKKDAALYDDTVERIGVVANLTRGAASDWIDRLNDILKATS